MLHGVDIKVPAVPALAPFARLTVAARYSPRTDLSPCCREPVGERGDCAGCGEIVSECRTCGGEGCVDVEYPATRYALEPDIRSAPCPTCQDEWYEDDEPDERPWSDERADDYYDERLARMGVL